jgi:hypothetical protein
MQVPSPRRFVRTEEVPPFGEVAFVPASTTGRPEPATAQMIAAALRDAPPESTAEALMRLRQAFPDTPLSVRVAALGLLMRR